MNPPANQSIRITASFTAEPLRGTLTHWLGQLGIGGELSFSGYGQILQEALDPSSASSRNGSGGANVFLLRPSDIGGALDEIREALAALTARSKAHHLAILCPEADASADEAAAVERLSGIERLEVVTARQWLDLYPVADAFDPEADASAHIPYSDALYAALATVIARRLHLGMRPPTKVLVLDADNTLWSGVCGEDGASGVELDGPWKAVRQFALAKRREGLLLALCSKNHPADVEAVFSERADELGLGREDFSGWKINWNPKSQNLRELADELRLGLDSFVFLDDNPAEVAEVAANCPGVVALTLPENVEEIPAFLGHLWPLDTAVATAEDATRAEFYRQENGRRELLDSAPSFADFLRSLDLDIAVAEATGEDLPRIAQLATRTNQFNLNPLRLSEAELKSRIEEGATCLAVRVRDRFGDYGLVGATLYRLPATDAPVTVDLFLLSCRAMGKGVERAMVIALAQRALSAGARTLGFAHQTTDRNDPARTFFQSIGGFQLDAADAAQLSPIPDDPRTEPTHPKATPVSSVARTGLTSALAQRIATEWRSPADLHRHLTAVRRPRPDLSQALLLPGTKLERQLADLWSELLGLETVGVDDPFSSLGGDSIRLVRLHAEILRRFRVPIELVELFELPTIRGQAARIETASRPIATTEDLRPATDANEENEDAVAIIGMALRVPGADSPDAFWRNLVDGVESISHFQRDEIEYPEEYGKPGYVPAKGLVEGIDLFDANFFGILPKDARIMDPQQRIFLELAWEAMERSGYTPETHEGRVGVYAGAYFDTYLIANLCTDREFLADFIPQIQVGSLQTELGNDKDYLATRVAFKMNLRGPAMTLQTACSTSMVAVVEACRAIRSGLCDMALAGGITLTLPYKRGYFYTEQGMLSKDGHCRAFDEDASGTVFGNGAGVVMLKRLGDAVRDGDHIHAVIRGTGMNNDGGVKHSYTAPSVEGQVDVIRMAHRDAGVEASTIGYIEAHGTGTPLGDPIEIAALTKAFRSSGADGNQFCAVGSLKTNIGHLDVASGVCGLIKTALSMEKSMLPPVLHYRKPNPKIDFANSPFFVNDRLRPWTEGRDGQPRRAGISAFGVGGTNAHVVVEEAPATDSTASLRSRQLFLLSARSEAALATAAENLAAHAADTAVDPADAAWTLAVGRKPFQHRRAVVASDMAELKEVLLSGKGVSGRTERNRPPVNFLFPGQGSQHVQMGRAFYENEPRFRALVDRCSEILRPHLGLSLVETLFPQDGQDLEAASDRLKNTVLAQPAIFVIEYALADLLMHWGIEPSAMIGHSVGEFVAACHAGVFTLEDGLRLLAARGRLIGELPSGGMLSVRLPEQELLARLPGSLDLAASNSPSLCVVAGSAADLAAFRTQLEADGIAAQPLHTSHAFHSRMMDPAVDRFAAEFAGIALHAPERPILSSVTGEWLTEADATDPLYWARHLREPVRFHRSLAKLAAQETGQCFVEVGPGQTLVGLVRQTVERQAGHVAVSTSLHVKEDGCDYAHCLESVGRLWTCGVEIDWKRFYSDERRKRVPLPTYPFERKRFWADPKPLGASEPAAPIPAAPALPLSELPLSNLPMSAPATECRREAIAAAIRSILTDLSGIPDSELTGDASFLELGFDSLLLTQVSKALQGEFGTGLTLRDLMGDLSSIDAMVSHLDASLPEGRYRASVAPVISAPSAPVISVPAAPVPSPTTDHRPLITDHRSPITDGTLETLVAQQLDLMRQQIALLQGSTTAPLAPTLPPTPSPAPDRQAERPPYKPAATSATVTSAPTTSINRVLDDTLTDRQRRHVDELVASYVARTRTSKELTARYRQWHADPRTVSGFNRRWKEMIYQIAVVKSKGSRLVDVDGNEYIDLLNGFGPNFLGHSPDFITEALKNQLDRGIEVGPQCVTAMEAAQLFCEVTGNERASFVNTGSEAVQAAMRLARTVTGRDKIVVFTKDYHGNFDEVLVKGLGSGDSLRSMPIAPGIPRRAVEDVIVLPYGTDEALDIIRSRAHELAAVIVEPIQSRRPEFQPREFIHAVREITRQSGTVFVFDEVITGFRTGPRGAQEYYGVEADIATYGKVVGGGMPLGVVAGKAEFMDTFDGGMWQYGDDSFPEKEVTFFAGTFVRHPLAMAAVKEVLLHLKGKTPEFWQNVRNRADRLAGSVDRIFVESGAPFRMPNFGSQMFVRAAEDHKYANLLFFHLRQKGVFLLEGFPSYMTAAHTDEDIDYCIAAFRESVAEMQSGGFFDVPDGGALRLDSPRLSGPPRLLTPSENPKPEVRNPELPSLHPLTEPQAEVWLASQISESSSLAFNEINVLKLRGALDIDALRAALQALVERHEALRAVYAADGSGFSIRPCQAVDLTLLDEAEADLELVYENERNTPFDLSEGPLYRFTLVRRADDDHVLVLSAHHLALDGWSYNVILAELAKLYPALSAGAPSPLPAAPSFVAHARETVGGETQGRHTEAERYWLDQLSEAIPPVSVPHSFTVVDETDFRGGTTAVHLSPDVVAKLKRVAGRSGATLFGLLFSTYQLLLHRLGGQQRFVVAFPVAGQSQPGSESLVGHCVSFLPFVAEIEPELEFPAFLRKTQARLLDALDHREATYGHLLKHLPPDRRPVIEAIFNHERMEDHPPFGGLEARVRELERNHTTNPLFLKACESESGLELRFDFHTSRFTEAIVAEWLDTLKAMIESLAADETPTVDGLAATLSDRQRKIQAAWNQTATAYPREATVPELFDDIARRRRDAAALRFQGSAVTYEELSDEANRIAHHLAETGVSPGDRVGIYLDRCPAMIAGILAVLKCGAAYVPLDPQFPVERIHEMVADSGAAAVLTTRDLSVRLPAGQRSVLIEEIAKRRKSPPFPPRAASSDSVACVLYTSGSTGKPKGALITHRCIVRLVRSTDYCEFGENEVILQAATFCFDPCLYDTYGALLNGGTLVLPPPGPLTIDRIALEIRQNSVTQMFLTSGLFQVMVDEQLNAFTGLRTLLTGGDIASPSHMAKFLAAHPRIRLVNVYGPTEATTFQTTHHVTTDDLEHSGVPIGRPIANSRVWILDSKLRPLPPGTVGELYAAGDGVALGYLGQPDLTAERFLPDPFSATPEDRLYRTGDLCKHRADGMVEFVSRIDHQVKVRGYRVEPGEIETLLHRHPSVRQCKVVAHGTGAADKRLVAYLSAQPSASPAPDELDAYLRAKVPSYMVPSAFVVLDELPLNANGKIDARALPDPSGQATDLREGVADTSAEPSTETEATLLELWRDVLGSQAIGLDDDFFALGGHSLMGMKLFARIQKTLGFAPPLAALFRAPTVRRLAALLDERTPEASDHETEAVEESREAEATAEAETEPVETAESHETPASPSVVVPTAKLADTTVALQPRGDLPPLFAVHGGDGGILFYGQLAERLGEARPFYAFEAPALTASSPIPDESVEQTAAHYLAEMLKVQPDGPYCLCGYSFGGVVAYEMARQLVRLGKSVDFLGLVDTENPAIEARKLSLGERIAVNWKKPNPDGKGVFGKVGQLSRRVSSGLAYRLYFEAEDAVARTLPEAKGAGWLRQVQLRKAHEKAMEAYVPGPYPGRLTLFRAMVGGDKFEIGDDYGWSDLVGELDIVDVPGNHVTIFHKEHIDSVAEAFREALGGVAAG